MIWPTRLDMIQIMLSKWHKLNCVSFDENEGYEAIVTAPLGSPWFEGHFPSQPILPGIAMIAMAFDVAQQIEAHNGKHIRLNAVKRIRFKKPVRPDEPISLVLKREQKEIGISYNFTILLVGEVACTGTINVELFAE